MATERQSKEWVEAALAPGEKVTWIGSPEPNVLAANHPIQAVDFWAAFGVLVAWVLILIAIASRFHSHDLILGVTLLSSVCFSVAFTFCIARRPLTAYARATRTIYALTDRRALILQNDGRNKNCNVRSLSAEDLSRMRWRERINTADCNDLVLESLSADETETVGFLGVYDSRALEQKIRSLVIAARV